MEVQLPVALVTSVTLHDSSKWELITANQLFGMSHYVT